MENKNQNLIYTILCVCALVVVIGGGYAYFTRDASKPADKGVTSDQVVDTKKDSVEHKVMKPAIPGDEESKTTDDPAKVAPKSDEPKLGEPKLDEPKLDEPKLDEPKSDEPKSDEPKSDEPKSDESKSDESKSDESKSDESKSDETKKSDDTNPDKSNI